MENGITKTVVTTKKVAKETRVTKAGTKTKLVLENITGVFFSKIKFFKIVIIITIFLGEWIYDENHAASSTNKSTTESTTTNGSLDKNNVANAVANENIVDQGAKAKVFLLKKFLGFRYFGYLLIILYYCLP